MTLVTFQDGKVVVRDGRVGTQQDCCCEERGSCCLPGEICEDGLTRQECEECVEQFFCYSEETEEVSPVSDCSGCTGFCFEGETVGKCGEFFPSATCEDCGEIDGGLGWYTDNYKADFEALLVAAGYRKITFVPASPFDGAPVPYTDGCGQTFYRVTYECCGESGPPNGCDPAFYVQVLRDAAGGGNQFPPCNISDAEVFLWSCCQEELPP